MPAQMLSFFTNRELAAIFWISVFILWQLTHRPVRESLRHVVSTLLNVRTLTLFPLFGIYISIWVLLAQRLDLWNPLLLKDTILWFLLAGIRLMFQFNAAATEDRFFRRAAFSVVGISAFLDFFFSIESLSLPAEMVLFPIYTTVGMLAVWTGSNAQYASQRRFWERLFLVIGVWIFVLTAIRIYATQDELDIAYLGRSLLLDIWLPLASLPFVYCLSLFAGYELAFMRMKFANRDRSATLATKLALLIGLNGHLRDVYAFNGPQAKLVASTSTFAHAWSSVQRYRSDQKLKRYEEWQRRARLDFLAGVDGVDANGRRLDQREFDGTKGALQWIRTCQMGWYRRLDGRYRPDLLEILGDFTSYGLPEDHDIELKVSDDGQAWYACRRTVSGWVFAIGASKAPPDEWLYDGRYPPNGYPGRDPSWGKSPQLNAAHNW